jgi:hypothetical protein
VPLAFAYQAIELARDQLGMLLSELRHGSAGTDVLD